MLQAIVASAFDGLFDALRSFEMDTRNGIGKDEVAIEMCISCVYFLFIEGWRRGQLYE